LPFHRLISISTGSSCKYNYRNYLYFEYDCNKIGIYIMSYDHKSHIIILPMCYCHFTDSFQYLQRVSIIMGSTCILNSIATELGPISYHSVHASLTSSSYLCMCYCHFTDSFQYLQRIRRLEALREVSIIMGSTCILNSIGTKVGTDIVSFGPRKSHIFILPICYCHFTN